jgi:hypothetical protein
MAPTSITVTITVKGEDLEILLCEAHVAALLRDARPSRHEDSMRHMETFWRACRPFR